MIKNIYTFLRGMVMGIAEVIPGVSGSTMALIMGIYDDFIVFLAQISDLVREGFKFLIKKSTFKDLKKEFSKLNLSFGIFLGFGMVVALGIFSHVVSYLMDAYPVYLFAFFFGLVIASMPIPYREMKKKNIEELVLFIISFVLFFLMLGMNPVEVATNPSYLLLFFGGMFAISGMLLPGISGSFILLLLGLYGYIINVVTDLTTLNVSVSDLTNLSVLGFGLVIGFLIVSKILKVLLKDYHSYLMSFLIALMGASLRVLWPLSYTTGVLTTFQILLIVVFALLGFLVVFSLQRFSVIDNDDAEIIN